MLKKYFINDLLTKVELNKEYQICGWVHKVRDIGKVLFIILRDRTGYLQCTVKRGEVSEETLKLAKELQEEDVILVKGILRQDPTRPERRELLVKEIKVLNKRVEPPPIEFKQEDIYKTTSLAKRLDYRWLDLRNLKTQAIFKLQAEIANAIREYFRENGFIEIFTPKIISSATESGAEVFEIKYFNRVAYLAQSPQFYKQMGVIAGLERVFEIGPVFRAEPHHTVRHLCEYHSVDFEIGWIEDENDVMDVVEGLVKYVLSYVKRKCKEILEMYNVDVEIPKEIPRIPMREAYKLLESVGKKLPYGEDLDPEGERLLCEIVKKEYDSELVFVTEYPWAKRPFYTMRKEEEPDWTKSFDLLYRGLEIVTGGQREHRYEILVKQAKEKGITLEKIKWYLEMFKHGVPPHGGAGMGLERITKQILMLKNIREARFLPRDPERLEP